MKQIYLIKVKLTLSTVDKQVGAGTLNMTEKMVNLLWLQKMM